MHRCQLYSVTRYFIGILHITKRSLPLFVIFSCSWFDQPNRKAALPNETQSGANTLGFLLNGHVWIPEGYNGTTNPSVFFDPSYRQGTLEIRAYRYTNGEPDAEYFILFADSLCTSGIYPIMQGGHVVPSISLSTCDYPGYTPDVGRSGSLTITRLDLPEGIIAGTFSFTMTAKGCDTLSVSAGRFDLQL